MLSEDKLVDWGLASLGQDVLVDSSVQIFGAEHVSIGSSVRIDCFCVITAGPGEVTIGNHVHLGVGACLLGTAGIRVGNFVSISPRATIFSTNDDFRSGHMTGPTVPHDYRNVHEEEVVVEASAVIGCGTVVLPGVRLGRGSSVGALSLVKGDVGMGEAVAGVPARVIGRRDQRKLREFERRLRGGDAQP